MEEEKKTTSFAVTFVTDSYEKFKTRVSMEGVPENVDEHELQTSVAMNFLDQAAKQEWLKCTTEFGEAMILRMSSINRLKIADVTRLPEAVNAD